MELNNRLIGISGQIKVGKDLVGEMVCYIGDGLTKEPTYKGFLQSQKTTKYSIDRTKTYVVKKYADKLKDCVCLILGCTREQLEDREYKELELPEHWDRYRLDSVYIPETLDSEYHERHTDTKYFATLDEATTYGVYHTEELNVPDDKRLFGMSADWSYEVEREALTPRKLLQLLGTEGGREIIHPNIWVNALFNEYRTYNEANRLFHYRESFDLDNDLKFEEQFPKWVITDVRFPNNEGKAVTDRGGLMIGVRRKFALRFPSFAHLKARDSYETPRPLYPLNRELHKILYHESEILMSDHSWCDVVIENNGTMEELFDNVLNAVTQLKII